MYKAELHVHLEGTVTPTLAEKLAARNKLNCPSNTFADAKSYKSIGFADFLNTFDQIAELICSPEDYRDVTYDYLMQCGHEGAIYVEYMPSPDHAAKKGMSYQNLLEGLVAGSNDAKRDCGIESRILISGVRHFGVDSCIQVAKLLERYPHPLVTGFGLGGDEVNFPPKQFNKAFAIAAGAGVSCTCHAGEWAGPDRILEAITHLPLKRIGHGVRVIEDDNVLNEVIARNIVLECAPGSNIALGVYPDYQQHPLKKLYARGVKVTLNSDDPPYFATTLGKEYERAKTVFALTDDDLNNITRNALHGAFCDEATRQRLLAMI